MSQTAYLLKTLNLNVKVTIESSFEWVDFFYHLNKFIHCTDVLFPSSIMSKHLHIVDPFLLHLMIEKANKHGNSRFLKVHFNHKISLIPGVHI